MHQLHQKKKGKRLKMTNENGFGLKKDNAEADGQNTSASKKRKLIKKVRDLSILSRKLLN